MTRKRIFISFDYTNDKHYRFLLNAFSANPKFDIDFIDATPEEIQSHDIGRIKAVLTSKIRFATHTLVVVGEEANSYHPDREKIGMRNWQWWEIEQSHNEGKALIGLKIKAAYSVPQPMIGKSVSWAHNFNVPSIIEALGGV